jgi:hypothetical protein
MISNALSSFLSNPSEKRTVHVSLYEGGEYQIIGFKSFIELTVQQICNGPYVIRINDPLLGRTYFVGTDEPYFKLQREGKNIRWIHDLIEYWRQDLIMKGFPKETTIYHWRLKDISILQKSLIVFPGSEVEVMQ